MIDIFDFDESDGLEERLDTAESDLRDISQPEDEFIAIKVTATGTGNACTWVERCWNTAGARIDKPNGLYGDATFSPAYPVGNGTLPITTFPFDTWARKRLVNGYGAIYEFDWMCACGALIIGSGVSGSGGSGSGGSSSGSLAESGV